ncbi:MAG: hypothetical protein HUK18_01490 [Bacteroidales bacterium]|nr:hypothetical protein [Bacteroidales bacterium]
MFIVKKISACKDNKKCIAAKQTAKEKIKTPFQKIIPCFQFFIPLFYFSARMIGQKDIKNSQIKSQKQIKVMAENHKKYRQTNLHIRKNLSVDID